MPGTHLRFYITWIVTPAAAGDAWSRPEDFVSHATRALEVDFAPYNAALSIAQSLQDNDDRLVFEMVWDVDTDTKPGLFHDWDDHRTHLYAALAEMLPAEIRAQVSSQDYREVPLSSAQDHGVLNMKGIPIPMSEVYRPETDPVFPEATRVWLQDGYWFWDMDRGAWGSDGPAVGDAPRAIFARLPEPAPISASAA